MQNDIAISVKNLGKCYQLYEKPYDRLKQALFTRIKKPLTKISSAIQNKNYHREFWALNDVSFEVKKGEAIGIIGVNGSGKSTLLQLISGTLTPTSGEIKVNGRVGALLELGAGFNPEFTGRENVYMSGAILGLTQKEIEAKFNDIIEFADIGEFLDQPVKTYSSGMFVRLAFAVQACIEPDILIVDEALAVGDIFFQQKCFERIRKLRDQGTTLIFVSHDMGAIRDLCTSGVYLKKGKIIFVGETTQAIAHYFRNDESGYSNEKLEHGIITNKTLENIQEINKTACWINNEEANILEAKILAVTVLDSNDQPTMKAQLTSELKIKVLYQTFVEQPVHVTIVLKNRYDHIVCGAGSYTSNTEFLNLKKGDYAVFELILNCAMEAGPYTFSVMLGYATETPNRGCVLDQTPWLGPLLLEWDYETKKAPWLGMFKIPCSTKFLPLDS